MVGDALSGKTSFVNRYVKDKFDLHVSQMNQKDMVFGDQSFKIDLWDYGTASNHAPNIFFRDAEAAIVFVDLSSPEEQLSDIYT